ncbi:MAG: hypothetical protein HZB46_02150 [Solirubrobacterales bacterium]|nr:hypothetical protein [Solirubrobacterales bacterium]
MSAVADEDRRRLYGGAEAPPGTWTGTVRAAAKVHGDWKPKGRFTMTLVITRLQVGKPAGTVRYNGDACPSTNTAVARRATGRLARR